MAFSRLIATFFLFSPLFGSFPPELSGQMLYLLHRGEVKQAFGNYLDYTKVQQEHDFALLQQAAIALLEQGIESEDPESALMSLFGAGVANTPDLLPVLKKGIESKEPRMQLAALTYLGKQQDDAADRLLESALSSPFLLTRLEGCLQLAQKNHPAVLTHLQSLKPKVPPVVRALFPQIIVHLEGAAPYHYLRQLLTDPEVAVRIEAILAIATEGRDDFLPQIRTLASEGHHAQLECAAIALGELQDTQSIPRLKKLLDNPRREVALAASIALYQLGEKRNLEKIETEAKSGDLFAIASLGILNEGKELLRTLIQHPDKDIRLNATLSLLQQGEAGAIDEILFPGKGDPGFVRIASPGRGLRAWKTISSHRQNTKAYPGVIQQTRGLRERVLTQTIELPEIQFFALARKLMTEHQTELIPLLCTLLENKQATTLLKEGQQRAGEPLIRRYCTLALYRLHEEGPYEELLIEWAKGDAHHNLIEFRGEEEGEPLTMRHSLTPEETSRFLIETFETLAHAQNQQGVEVLVHAIAYGNPKNRYALAGLLIRTTE